MVPCRDGCTSGASAPQICFTLIHTAIIGADNIFRGFSWIVWVVAMLWPVVGFVWVGIVKNGDIARFRLVMRRLRIHFDTKLGMYSPK